MVKHMDTRKYGNRAVIEPSRVIQERRMTGLHPSCPVPEGAIMCYDAALWQWIKESPGYVENDGWLKGSYLVSYNNSLILILKVPGFGTPTAVLTFEELIAFGIKTFVSLGAVFTISDLLSEEDWKLLRLGLINHNLFDPERSLTMYLQEIHTVCKGSNINFRKLGNIGFHIDHLPV